MKENEIRVGGLYLAKVSGAVTTVRVDAIRNAPRYSAGNYGTYHTRDTTVYDITNLRTGRKTTFRSAAKFRGAAKDEYPNPKRHEVPHITTEDSACAELDQRAQKVIEDNEPEASKESDPTERYDEDSEQWIPVEGEQSADPTHTPALAAGNHSLTPGGTVPIATSLASRIATTRQMHEPGTTVAGMVPNAEQESILSACSQSDMRVLVIAAGAGTGKTSTLKMLEQVLPGRGQYTAFNTSLVAESKAKFSKAACNTTHSLAFRAVGRRFAHRLNGPRVRSHEVANRLGIEDYYVELPEAVAPRGEDGKLQTRRLKASWLAGQVMTAIRKFCMSAAAEITDRHLQRVPGIDAEGESTNSDKVKAYLLLFAQKMWTDLSSETGSMPFAHDVYVKCQPAGTMVSLAGNQYTPARTAPIERVEVGQRVFGIPDHSKGTLPIHTVMKIGSRQFDGDLVVVESGGMVSKYTPDHICICRVGDAMENKSVVYLMRRGSNYRIGRTQWQLGSQNKSLGIVVRASMNDADAVWVLSVHDSDADAALEEAMAQYHFGIPGWQFVSRNELMPLEQFWNGPKGVGDNTHRAENCVATFGRDIKYPLWEIGQARQWNRSAVEVRACNLMTGMKFCDAKRIHVASKRDEVWVTGKVVREPFTGTVYSMEVDGNHTYIADGIATHNCWQLGRGADRPVIAADYILLDEAQDTAPVFLDVLKQQTHALLIFVGDSNQAIYEWRGAVDAMKAYPDAERRLLSQSYRFGQAVADVANAVLATLDEPTDLIMRGMPGLPSRIAPVAQPRCYLHRTNAGAIGEVMVAIAAGRRPHLIGGGADVVAWCQAAYDLQTGRGTQHPELGCFDNWCEVVEYSKTDEGADLKLMVKLVELFGAVQIRDALKNMPREDAADVVVSTAHKSKGREWDTVKLGQDFPTANKMSDSNRRLLYVAVTRAKLTLDISECPPFCGGDDRSGGEGGDWSSQWVPGITINYTAPMPTEEEQVKWCICSGTAGSSKSPTDPGTAPAPMQVVEAQEPAGPTTRSATSGDMFTWANMDGTWCVRGPKDRKPGERVTVRRRNGTKSQETIKQVTRKLGDFWFYSV